MCQLFDLQISMHAKTIRDTINYQSNYLKSKCTILWIIEICNNNYNLWLKYLSYLDNNHNAEQFWQISVCECTCTKLSRANRITNRYVQIVRKVNILFHLKCFVTISFYWHSNSRLCFYHITSGIYSNEEPIPDQSISMLCMNEWLNLYCMTWSSR